MSIFGDLLEKTCKNMITTILFCLENATKGTIYRIGSLPRLQAMRVTSGIRREGSDVIVWGLPSVSDYNYPGKSWEQYRDRPGHVLEAMGWCVEKQKSWTAENPFEDVRSVGKQLRGEIEDFYHMEPVLVPKVDLYGTTLENLEYALDWRGSPIWQDSEYVVAAVIKIHFKPHTLRREDRSTKIIKELSRTLGTELLSLHLREKMAQDQKEFARQRLRSYEILAHELRNTLIKFGFIFSAVNAQIGVLRQEWEEQLQKALPGTEWKGDLLARLTALIQQGLPLLNGHGELVKVSKALLQEQEEMADLPLLPYQGEQWIKHKIGPKWERLLAESQAWASDKEEVIGLLEHLQKVIWIGVDQEVTSKLDQLSIELRQQWQRLAYTYFTADKLPVLREIIQFLDHRELPITHRQQIQKTIQSLMSLVEVLPEVEGRANRIIQSLRNESLMEIGTPHGLAQSHKDADSCPIANDMGIPLAHCSR